MKKFVPKEISDVDYAFGSVNGLLPEYSDIPSEFKGIGNKWNRVFNDWFFNGLNHCTWKPKDGVNSKMAIRHIATIMRSFEPTHERKEAGCAYLMSLWFDDVSYDTEE